MNTFFYVTLLKSALLNILQKHILKKARTVVSSVKGLTGY